ncbi:hydroxylamine reductase [Candidatus Bathyarchaeota archaeon]|nr:hydroxylamine reductase [Candidatus Bathyarchaeota archaeon]
MFCYQCEQTSGSACTKYGVCGKSPEIAALQDLLIYITKGVAHIAVEGNKHGISDPSLNRHIAQAVFSTLTNVNFDSDRFVKLIIDSVERREKLKKKIALAGGPVEYDEEATGIIPAVTTVEMVNQGAEVGIMMNPDLNPDIRSLQELLVYGIKGVAAYADHAAILGQEDETVYQFIAEGLAATLDPNKTADEIVGLVLKCGEVNLRAMELLDAGNTGKYGHPVPTSVPLTPKAGKAILVSGHDLQDMEMILSQTEGKGINVYTHGEMLPTHGYPELKKYEHFYGHYGTAWQNQQKEFAQFPGAIVMTTNCIQKPTEAYMDNLFTTGLVGWPGVDHIGDKDFSPAIEKALEMSGFSETEEGKSVTVGFARNAVMGVAGAVIEAVKNKDIRHFFLVGGCDGAKPGRNYYTEFVEKAPADTVILTLACGKFRFFDKELGDIGGIPRLLDIGQCNDAYSAVQIAVALANAFELGVNELPLSFILSWYEQKAVSILLTLLHLGIQNIRLGPSLPAFITPNILNVLVENFNIAPVSTPDEDLKAILG